jgi:hypothetical protein
MMSIATGLTVRRRAHVSHRAALPLLGVVFAALAEIEGEATP